MFWLLSILVYLRANRDDHPRPWLLAGCWLLALAAMLCKAPAVTLPLVLVILDFYPLRRLGGVSGRILGPSPRRAWLEKLPFFALSAVVAAISVQARSGAYGPEAGEQILSRRAALISYRITFYPIKSVVPTDLTPYRPTPALRPMTLSEPRSALRAAAVVAFSLVLVRLRRRCPGALAAWVAYLIIIAPNLGLILVTDPMITADRYSYLSTMGGYVLLAAAIAAMRSRPAMRLITTAAGLAVIVLLIPVARAQCESARFGDVGRPHIEPIRRSDEGRPGFGRRPVQPGCRHVLARAVDPRRHRGAARPWRSRRTPPPHIATSAGSWPTKAAMRKPSPRYPEPWNSTHPHMTRATASAIFSSASDGTTRRGRNWPGLWSDGPNSPRHTTCSGSSRNDRARPACPAPRPVSPG